MARNYNAIHYMQNKLSGFDQHFVNAVVRAFNILNDTQSSNECMSMSACLYVIAKKYGYSPELCYGLCKYEGYDFYHAWIEINNTIIDLAIYGNINFSPYSLWDNKLDTPLIGSYEELPVHYGKYQFDEDWLTSNISIVTGKTLEQYMDGLPQNAMWKMVCKILDITPSKTIVNELRLYSKDMLFDKTL